MKNDEPRRDPNPPQPTFSAELRELAARFSTQPVCLADILEATKGRGFHLLLLLISLPFTTPIPTPGISMPFGLAVSVIGARLALGQRPWLPQRLLLRRLPPGFIASLLSATGRVVGFLERFLRPRLAFLHEQLFYRCLSGVLIAVSGIYMMLPLPVPFSNGLPALTVLLLAAATLARDGVFFIAGSIMFAFTTAFFVLLAIGGAHAAEQLRRFFTGG